MDISYHGANSVEISIKGATIVTDPTLSRVGLKDITVKDGIYLATQVDFMPQGIEGTVVEGPGEYEIKNITVTGVPAMRTVDHDGSKQATIYKVTIGDISIAIIGHVTTPLTEEQFDTLSVIDIVVIPVGGSGYTLDAHQAAELVRQLDPKVVIPTHYDDPAIKYEVPQMGLEPFTTELSAPQETMPKYKIKNGILPAALTVIELTRS